MKFNYRLVTELSMKFNLPHCSQKLNTIQEQFGSNNYAYSANKETI